MSLITPDFGLLVWMTLIFGIVLFILAKWGFPMITQSVRERAERISASIRKAKEAEDALRNLAEQQARLVESAKAEQLRILQEAAASRDALIEQAKAQAQDEAGKILSRAREEIAAEKETALREIRSLVADLSVDVAEKVLREELSAEGRQEAYIGRLVDELTAVQTGGDPKN